MKDINNKKTQLQFIKPFVYARPSISSVLIRFLLLLSVQIIMLLITKSYAAFSVVISAVLGAACAASISYLTTHEPPFHAMSIIIQGIFIGLLLPEKYPLVIVFFISFIALFISITIAFRSINSWINVCAVAVIIAWFIGRQYFPEFTITSDLIPLRNSSVYLIQNGNFPIYEFDSTITNFLNSTIFGWLKVSIPEGFISLLWDTHSVIPAFRFNLITIISSIIIFSDNAFSGIVPTLFLLFYGLLVRLFAPMMFGGFFNKGDIILAMLTSGTLFSAVFLIQWYGTVPSTIFGKVLLGFASGITAFLIVGCGTSPIGMVYTILITNIVSMFIKSIEERKNQITTAKVVQKLVAKGVN